MQWGSTDSLVRAFNEAKTRERRNINIKRQAADSNAQSRVERFDEEKWPRLDVPGAFAAEVVYLSISVTAMIAGRYLIGQCRPPADDGGTSSWSTDFGFSTPERCPIIIPLSENDRAVNHDGPPRATRVSSEFMFMLPT